MRILMSPAGYEYEAHKYARLHYLVTKCLPVDSEAVVVVSEDRHGTSPLKVTIRELGHDSSFRYSLDAYQIARRCLANETFDIYQHPFLAYPEFNPVLLAPPDTNVPVVVGPVETGHDVDAAAFGWLLSALVGREVPNRLSESLFGLVKPGLSAAEPVRKRLAERSLQNADRVVAVSEDTKDLYAEFVNESKITTIPYGVDLDRFQVTDDPRGTDFLTVGHLIPRKGHTHLFEAFERVHAEIPDVGLDVVGEGPYGDRLRQEVRERGLSEVVQFHGRVDRERLLGFYHRALAFVHPSLSEGYSHVRLEAMATGCPVIGTDVTAAREMCRDGVEGFVVPRGDSTALASAMHRVATDRELAANLGQNARERIESKFSWNKVGSQWRSLYRALA